MNIFFDTLFRINVRGYNNKFIKMDKLLISYILRIAHCIMPVAPTMPIRITVEENRREIAEKLVFSSLLNWDSG